MIWWWLENGLRLGQHKIVAHPRIDGVQARLGRYLEGRMHLDALTLVAIGNDRILVAIELHLKAYEAPLRTEVSSNKQTSIQCSLTRMEPIAMIDRDLVQHGHVP